MRAPHQYARIERERRFLVAHFPDEATVVRVRHIVDRYIEGTTLRLRQQWEEGGATVNKLTQKISARSSGAQQGFLTSMYVTEGEYEILARLPARILVKTRHSVPPFGIDVFEGTLRGLRLAEAEFDSAEEADALTIPRFVAREVTDDDRFTGGRLVHVSRYELQEWLAEYGIDLGA